MSNQYFSGINYSLGNEDTTLEYELCRQHKPKVTVAIAGSGGRSLPLLAFSDKLFAVDVSKEQLALTELRALSYQHLDHYSFLKFWGYPPFGEYDYSNYRRVILNELPLTHQTRSYFHEVFGPINYASILYLGKWERTFQILSKGLRLLLGRDYGRILSFHSLEDQKAYYDHEFPMAQWKAVLFLLGNKSVFNALLYKGDFVKKSLTESYFQFYFDAFESLFKHQLARRSFFVNLCFFGKINHEDGNPLEVRATTFNEMKPRLQNLEKDLMYINQDILGGLATIDQQHGPGGVDFLSISDVPSYFTGDLEKNFLTKIRPSLRSGGLVSVRYYLNVLEPSLEGFQDVTDQYRDLITRECVQMYRIKIYKAV
ncbi:MAG: hypothetical protein A2X86_15430 [Bdellovibrionales bacterium GWA2_49_15]|nr:MAG: hypothetical protein A2X86_15430 [Bdellovibrionales bacterium GWA2_49_15]HAZ14521.1 hypothetical protein [Bdellovibrionales bacterium]